MRSLIVLYFLLQLGHILRCDGAIDESHALFRLLLVLRAVLLMVISNANWRLGTYYFLCKTPLSSALASRSEYFAHFIIVPITPPSSSFTISWHRFPLVALFMATVFNISRTSYIYNIYINIFRPFYQGQFGHAAFWVLGSLLGVGWFRASCHGT